MPVTICIVNITYQLLLITMKYYCRVCDNYAWFYDPDEPDCYCEYCDKTYPAEDFYPDEEMQDADRWWDHIDDRVHELKNERIKE